MVIAVVWRRVIRKAQAVLALAYAMSVSATALADEPAKPSAVAPNPAVTDATTDQHSVRAFIVPGVGPEGDSVAVDRPLTGDGTNTIKFEGVRGVYLRMWVPTKAGTVNQCIEEDSTRKVAAAVPRGARLERRRRAAFIPGDPADESPPSSRS